MGNTCEIMKDNKVKAFAASNGTLHPLVENDTEFAAVATVATMEEQNLNYEVWYRRLGHLGMGNVKLMHDKELVSNMKCVKGAINRDCKACIKEKMTRKPFQKTPNIKLEKY